MNPLIIGLLLFAFGNGQSRTFDESENHVELVSGMKKDEDFSFPKREAYPPPQLGNMKEEPLNSVFLRPVPPPDFLEETECNCTK